MSATDTEIKVKIIDMMSSTSRNIDINLPVGHPNGTDELNYEKGIKLEPKLIDTMPNIGSLGGSLVMAMGKGFGNMTSNITLVTSTGADICVSVTLGMYGELYCKTKENVAYTSQTLQL